LRTAHARPRTAATATAAAAATQFEVHLYTLPAAGCTVELRVPHPHSPPNTAHTTSQAAHASVLFHHHHQCTAQPHTHTHTTCQPNQLQNAASQQHAAVPPFINACKSRDSNRPQHAAHTQHKSSTCISGVVL
jgi:hypothetical protein